MCGIIGYTGKANALPVLIEGLHALEYRGYDSAGIAFFEPLGLCAIKSEGRVAKLESKISPALYSNTGIGHTRWATHGAPSDINAHPHGTKNLYIVHNGIIENYTALKDTLEAEGYTFISETDTEVAAMVIDREFFKTGDPYKALQNAAKLFVGSFAIAAIFKNYKGKIFGIRRGNPLIAAPSEKGNFLVSDISAALCHTDRFITLEDMETVVIDDRGIEIFDQNGNLISRSEEQVSWNRESAEKGGFAHYMIKEIHEEPDAVIKTLRPHVKNSMPFFNSPLLTAEKIKGYSHIHIVACGTAYHAGLVAKVAFEKLARRRVSVEIASEFRYRDPILNKNDLVILISQSGETADTLAALRLAKDVGAATLGIVNVAGSTLAREADDLFFTLCGPEIAVASTKAYTVQISLLYLLSLHFAYSLGILEDSACKKLTEELISEIPQKLAEVIGNKEKIEEIALRLISAKSIFFMGRGIDYALAAEAALKCKEISYIHCEAYAAGELKHGTISLIEENVPVIAIMTNPFVSEKTVSNIKEVKSRGASLTLITSAGLAYPQEAADRVFALPNVTPLFSPMLSGAAVQLLAYYLSLHLGIDVDKPRNLAKSVTVE